jgi:hypothetical protein
LGIREPNAKTLSAQREKKSGEAEEDELVLERNTGHSTMDSYHLSIVLLFTCMLFEQGVAEVEGFEGVAWG